MRYFSTLLLAFGLLIQGLTAQAQPALNPDLLSDQQLIQLFSVGTEKNMTLAQLEIRAQELGFTPAQLPALKKRLEQLRQSKGNNRLSRNVSRTGRRLSDQALSSSGDTAINSWATSLPN